MLEQQVDKVDIDVLGARHSACIRSEEHAVLGTAIAHRIHLVALLRDKCYKQSPTMGEEKPWNLRTGVEQ